jgi:hypothetical protein
MYVLINQSPLTWNNRSSSIETVDPWFNFRATKYLVQHGFANFWDWFDDSEYILPTVNNRTSDNAFLQEHGTLSAASPAVPSTLA